MLDKVQTIGSATGIAGALLIALNLPVSAYGFALFLVSSLSWTAVGIWLSNRPMWTMNLAFTAINVLGIYRWLLA